MARSQMSKVQAVARVKAALERIPAVMSAGGASQEFARWKHDVEVMLGYVFGKSSRQVREFRSVSYGPEKVGAPTAEAVWHQCFLRGLANARNLLELMITEIQECWSDAVGLAASGDMGAVSGVVGGSRAQSSKVIRSRVFVGLSAKELSIAVVDRAKRADCVIFVLASDALAVKRDRVARVLRCNVVLGLVYLLVCSIMVECLWCVIVVCRWLFPLAWQV